ncbi:gastrokine-2-like [Ambystoma mexicanum]|uniref:gastrokine-2-like n=1 Tax=Ambystoma mexicanum TaxID=8296 RepID=UPI0037E894E9
MLTNLKNQMIDGSDEVDDDSWFGALFSCVPQWMADIFKFLGAVLEMIMLGFCVIKIIITQCQKTVKRAIEMKIMVDVEPGWKPRDLTDEEIRDFVKAIQIINQGNDGGNVYQTVNVNQQTNVAVFNIYAGRRTSNVILDYNQNIIAYHMPYKGICVVAHMHLSSFPGLGRFEEFIHSKRDLKKDLEALRKHYQITNNQVNNLAQFGGAIQGLCWDVPTYWAVEYEQPQSPEIGGGGCAGARFLFLEINLCGGIHLF